jgi:hypothetical protein
MSFKIWKRALQVGPLPTQTLLDFFEELLHLGNHRGENDSHPSEESVPSLQRLVSNVIHRHNIPVPDGVRHMLVPRKYIVLSCHPSLEYDLFEAQPVYSELDLRDVASSTLAQRLRGCSAQNQPVSFRVIIFDTFRQCVTHMLASVSGSTSDLLDVAFSWFSSTSNEPSWAPFGPYFTSLQRSKLHSYDDGPSWSNLHPYEYELLETSISCIAVHVASRCRNVDQSVLDIASDWISGSCCSCVSRPNAWWTEAIRDFRSDTNFSFESEWDDIDEMAEEYNPTS